MEKIYLLDKAKSSFQGHFSHLRDYIYKTTYIKFANFLNVLSFGYSYIQ